MTTVLHPLNAAERFGLRLGLHAQGIDVTIAQDTDHIVHVWPDQPVSVPEEVTVLRVVCAATDCPVLAPGRAVTARKLHVGADAMLSFEYACDRRCQVEIDLNDERGGITLNGLRQSARAAHDQAHLEDLHLYRFAENITVRGAR